MEKNMMLNVENANGMDMPNVKEVCGSLSAYIINKVKKPVDMLQGLLLLRVGETGQHETSPTAVRGTRGFHFDDFHRLLPPHACSVCRLVCMERVEKRKRDEKLRVRSKERRIRSLRKGRGASHNSVTASSPQLLIPHFNQTFLQPAQCRPQECLFLLSYYKERNWHGLYPRCRDCP